MFNRAARISAFLIIMSAVFLVSAMVFAQGTAEDHLQNGLDSLDEFDDENAIAEFSKAINLNPGYEEAYLWRGYAYYEDLQYNLALSDLNKASELAPKDARVYLIRGDTNYQLYIHKRDSSLFDQCISDYTKSTEIDPKFAEAYEKRAEAYFHSDNSWGKALADYDKAIELEPAESRYYENRGFAYYSRKDYDSAWRDVHKAQSLGETYFTYLEDLKRESGRNE